ncbi:DUF3021 domain-containing protein [Enterococcus sp. AZ109]|uniref:DUF3021 domain-containing protein n=1 Tax=Enterococcus sp. AZ109 TaxID=2774634 RepID=UPI003F2482EB
MKVIKAGIGGMLVGSLIFLLLGLFFVDDQVRNMIIGGLLMSLLIGMLSRVYDSSMPLLPAAAIHLLGSYLLFFTTAYLFKWFPFAIGPVFGGSLMFIAIFLIIWTGYYFAEKKQLAKMNDRLK